MDRTGENNSFAVSDGLIRVSTVEEWRPDFENFVRRFLAAISP